MYFPVVIMSPELSFEIKRKQRSNGAFVSPTILYSLRSVYNMSVCGQCRKQVLVCEVYSSQHYSKFITNITSEIVSQIRTKECKPGSFICNVDLSFLRSSRHFNFDTVFAVIVSFLNENVHGFNNIRNRRVKTRFQVIEFWWLWKFFCQKT